MDYLGEFRTSTLSDRLALQCVCDESREKKFVLFLGGCVQYFENSRQANFLFKIWLCECDSPPASISASMHLRQRVPRNVPDRLWEGMKNYRLVTI